MLAALMAFSGGRSRAKHVVLELHCVKQCNRTIDVVTAIFQLFPCDPSGRVVLQFPSQTKGLEKSVKGQCLLLIAAPSTLRSRKRPR